MVMIITNETGPEIPLESDLHINGPANKRGVFTDTAAAWCPEFQGGCEQEETQVDK